MRRVFSLAAASAMAVTGAVLAAPSAAQATGCSVTVTCGAVNNNSRFAMHITLKWNEGPDKCARWTGGGTPEIKKCDQQYLAPYGIYGGRMKSGDTYKYVDVDAFTYNSTNFYWAGTLVTKGQWIKMNNGGTRRCTAAVGDLPRCS
ncbi:hypothetical protein [Actinoplanes couchii]|nr:hypothetical protein [Actinoplanes couchii]MDR6316673.1 hypothetical protein [Actinoplanes couchii]